MLNIIRYKFRPSAYALQVTVWMIVTLASFSVYAQPKAVAVHVIENNWASLIFSHCDLRSYVFAVREGQSFGPEGSRHYGVAAKPFVLHRIISTDSIVIGYDSNLTYAGNSDGPRRDKKYDVAISHEYARISTRSDDAGIDYFLRIDSVYASEMLVPADLGSNGRETTDSERPDTSFLLHTESIDTITGDRTAWTERLDTAHSGFVRHGLLRSYFSGGSRKEETEYILGDPYGSYRRWYNNGQMEVEGAFAGGTMQGIFKFWNRDGSLAGEARFDSGNGTVALKYENGQTHLTGQYKSSYPWGLWREWYPNGQIAREEVVGEGGSRLPPVSLQEKEWFEFPKTVPPAWDQRATSASGKKAWYEDGRIKAAGVYDTTALDTPFDIHALIKPFDSEAVKELGEAGSVTGGKLLFPGIERRHSRCRVEREWYSSGQISLETICHDDLSVRTLAWDTAGNLTQVGDWRPSLVQRLDINWGPDGRIESWRISDYKSPSSFTTYEIRYRGGLRAYSELSHSRNGNRELVKFDETGRPIWSQTWRDGQIVNEETLNPDTLSQDQK